MTAMKMPMIGSTSMIPATSARKMAYWKKTGEMSTPRPRMQTKTIEAMTMLSTAMPRT